MHVNVTVVIQHCPKCQTQVIGFMTGFGHLICSRCQSRLYRRYAQRYEAAKAEVFDPHAPLNVRPAFTTSLIGAEAAR